MFSLNYNRHGDMFFKFCQLKVFFKLRVKKRNLKTVNNSSRQCLITCNVHIYISTFKRAISYYLFLIKDPLDSLWTWIHIMYTYSVLKIDPHCKTTPMLNTFIAEWQDFLFFTTVHKVSRWHRSKIKLYYLIPP